jgi:hypothetical protein
LKIVETLQCTFRTLEKAHASGEIEETFGAYTLNMLVKTLQHLKHLIPILQHSNGTPATYLRHIRNIRDR